MSLFISDAYAQAAGAPQQGGFMQIIFLGGIFVVFYFLLIRPQQKRAKEHKKMTEAIAKGDEVVTNGGTLGKVTGVGESFVTVEVATGVEIKVQRTAIQALMPKGTIKSA
ncbi:preprotein translocase subunit YajC [bacterium BMS3Bbin11]|nr:preprotein translocase subunit YajC [bacterium BMS3Abin11]GBE45474.1 preprotein translocase subunit YajC [bacterium BMS3Bbin11]GMT40875.1 MAG: preprotein translocase subunit YajC [bacterium]HDH15678.1 preprotein translocase subunit YajC [Gammaproteobacteria bacterium]HDZ78309.1 preprotein translocase subunit YajC [Gammaproteobacteria bacterium]